MKNGGFLSEICGFLPKSITAGTTLEMRVSFRDVQPPSWALAAALRGPSVIDLAATADGSEFVFNVAASESAGWVQGSYFYMLRATSGALVREMARSEITILPNLAAIATVGFDGRSDAKKALDAIDAVIAKRATTDQNRYRINNRELWRMTVSELLKLRTFYAIQVRRESGNNRIGRLIPVVFR